VGSQGSQDRDASRLCADTGRALHTPTAPGSGVPSCSSTPSPAASSQATPSRKALMDLLEKVESKVHESARPSAPAARTASVSRKAPAAGSSSSSSSGLAAMLNSKRASAAAADDAPKACSTSVASVPEAIEPRFHKAVSFSDADAERGAAVSVSVSVSVEEHCAGTQHTQKVAEGATITATDAGLTSSALRQQSRYEVLEVRISNHGEVVSECR
jgi:hypothetical protein